MLESCIIENTRIVEKADIEFSERFTVINGLNGSGKTSLLEGLYFAINGKSFLTRDLQKVISYNKDFLKVDLFFSDDFIRTIYSRSNNIKRVELNSKAESFLNIATQFVFFVFNNRSLSAVRGSNRDVYDFFNKILLRLSRQYLRAYRDYSKALLNKRVLLRNSAENAIIEPWNKVMEDRRKTITNKRKWLCEMLNNCLSSDVKIGYKPDNEGKDLDYFLLREISEKKCLAGSHRDRFIIQRKNRDIRFYSSSGQQRAVFFDVLTALGNVLSENSKNKPMLLLDDFDAEFDRKNLEVNIKKVFDLYQIVLTTTDREKYNQFPQKLIEIEDGKIRSSVHE